MFPFCSQQIKPGPNWPISAAVIDTYQDAVFYVYWWYVWCHYMIIMSCCGDWSVNCWVIAQFWNKTAAVEINKFHAPLPPRFGISSMKLHCCYIQGEKYSGRGRRKAYKAGFSHSGPKWEFINLENAVKWRGSSWGRRFCLLGGLAVADLAVPAFCHPQTKLPWPARGTGEGFMLSELKLVLTDRIRIHFIALGVLGESAWKKYPKFSSHFWCNKWIWKESGH